MNRSMKERVARAICACDERDGGPSWERCGSDKARARYLEQAEAVLQEMREPSDEMAKVGKRCAVDYGPIACWRSMMDVALEECA